ncbi:MAG: hypothetical protein EOP04_00160 [Proteobacteria bacterium]|nr:MAG: hypothetical protein EOP04_00160 [Pseudomonadota bacterium]
MKKVIALFLALTTSSLSFAMVPASPNAPVAKIETSSGFGPVSWVKTITIDRTGRVLLTNSRDGQADELEIMTLSAEALDSLIETYYGINLEADLVDLDPRSEGCTDAPSTTYSIVQSRTLAVLAEHRSCKTFLPANNAGSETLRILRAIEDIANYVHK